MRQRSQILFTQGGQGGTGRTTIVAALAAWVRTKGFDPVLLDFDTPNTHNCNFQSFCPEAHMIDICAQDPLDKLFHFLEQPGSVIIADQLPASLVFSWFNRTAEIVKELADVTSIGIVTKDPGSVTSILTWAYHLGTRVRYLVVLNELVHGTGFDAWCNTPVVKEFLANSTSAVVALENRNPDFETMLRENHLTLEKVIAEDHSVGWFYSPARVLQARRYQHAAYMAFEAAAHVLLPDYQTGGAIQ